MGVGGKGGSGWELAGGRGYLSGNWNIEELYCIVYIVQSRGGRGGWWGFSFSVVAEEVGWGVGGGTGGRGGVCLSGS